MPGIGDTLRAERQRQGRTLADAAAETRVRESYLAALEDEDFGVLGGDVYVRGFIRLYGRYLSLDAEALVAAFRRDHEKPEEVTAIPGAMVDRVMAPSRPPLLPPQPVLAAVGVVAVLVVLFLLLRGGEEPVADQIDPNAPGPSPAAAQDPGTEGAEDLAASPATQPSSSPSGAAPGSSDPVAAPPASPGVAGGVMTEVTIVVTAIQPVTLTVDRGAPPVSGATLAPGDSRTLTDPAGQQVVFTVSDFSSAEITVNGGPLINAQLAGTPVQISCTVGETACNATPL